MFLLEEVPVAQRWLWKMLEVVQRWHFSRPGQLGACRGGPGVRFGMAPGVLLFFPRRMKTTCVMKGKPALPWRIFYSYLRGMEICELCSCLHVLRLRTLGVRCSWRPQEGMALLWKHEGKEDQASHWLGWGRQMQKEALSRRCGEGVGF